MDGGTAEGEQADERDVKWRAGLKQHERSGVVKQAKFQGHQNGHASGRRTHCQHGRQDTNFSSAINQQCNGPT